MADGITDEQVTAALRVLVDEGLMEMPVGRVADFFPPGYSFTSEQEAEALAGLRSADEQGAAHAREIVRRALAAALDA